MALTKYQKIARRAIDKYFKDSSKSVVSLYQLSVVADNAAYDAGKKRELFSSLEEYQRLLPSGANVFWDKKTGLLSVVNTYRSAPVEEMRFLPGAFDAWVDMGPDINAARLKE
ncbi:hypothetical protein IT084_15760 [Desulfallas sp. Bu1-1]|uniref:hypothetical protein n=1 Tax=Desulfallas sp. Bu1-1 TaxID=2787620 RepID=UPI00189F6B22|nr:hypothetical protein [Desulfallas sp. Bu1-1]MBF7084409.1 hypothetical protein [Desulfallas sp. Bu1-1]